jgi:hypothetical protein
MPDYALVGNVESIPVSWQLSDPATAILLLLLVAGYVGDAVTLAQINIKNNSRSIVESGMLCGYQKLLSICLSPVPYKLCNSLHNSWVGHLSPDALPGSIQQ